jgi:hypothetical protein
LAAVSAVPVTIDFSKPLGKIRPLNGVNNGPVVWEEHNAAMVQRHKNAGFTMVRLHDDHNWRSADVVDISSIFPLFNLDANDSMNYTFKKTDAYIAAIINNGSQILWRLGQSIEHTRSYFTNPPSDYNKWATICVNIIRHYNAGWNKGFHYGIKYWEIWNEPENREMWSGSADQYLQLYGAAVKAIKAYDATLKVGGMSFMSWGNGTTFLAYCRDNSLPLDFYAYNGYSNSPSGYKSMAVSARDLVNSYGFTNAEIHHTEWDCFNTDWGTVTTSDSLQFPAMRDAFQAMVTGSDVSSLIASTLIAFQDSPIDMCYYYAAGTNRYGMFDQYGNPFTSYYAYVAWNQLLKTPNRVTVTASLSGDQRVIAGKSDNGSTAAFMVSNYQQGQTQFSVTLNNIPSGTVRADQYQVDATHNFQLMTGTPISGNNASITLDMATNTVLLVKLISNTVTQVGIPADRRKNILVANKRGMLLVTLPFHSKGGAIEIVNANGRSYLRRENVQDGKFEFNTGYLAPGLYSFNYLDRNFKFSKRLLVTR